MKIEEVLDEKTWERFVISQFHTPFLQSWAWGEFQDALGNSHFRLGAFEGKELVGVASAILMRRKLGKFLYVPHGPLLKLEVSRREVGSKILDHLTKLAEKEGVDYVRVEPRWEDSVENQQILKEASFRQAVSPVQAKVGWLLDLHPSEEELLMAMRKTTRYLVRKGREMGVEIHQTRNPEKMNKFHRLMEVTVRRQGFTAQPRSYLQKQFGILAPRRMAELFLAEYKGDSLAGAILISYGDTVSYVHGASVHSEVPAAYFLQWEAIRTAKKEDLDIFDFWGIAESDDPRHPWYGLSLFKKGFGGYRVEYLGAWDFPLTNRYLAVAGVEQTRKFLRRF